MSALTWWARRVRQFVRYMSGRVTLGERAALYTWLTSSQLDLFDRMHRADQRHGLDVVAALRRAGTPEPALLLAGLLHDAGKGKDLHLWHRVAWALAERHPGLEPVFLRVPSFRTAFATMADHPERSARLALEAGCSARTADLIRHQAEPSDEELVVALRLADEAS
jgi:hypothetical protein